MPRRSHLTDEDRDEIRRKYREDGWTLERLADWYWVSIKTIWRIVQQ